MTHKPNPQNFPPERSRLQMENQIAELEAEIDRLRELLGLAESEVAAEEIIDSENGSD